MPDTEFSKQLRAILASSADATPLPEFLELVHAKRAELSSSDNREYLLGQFDEELQNDYDEAVDHGSLCQLEVFLAVLYHLRPLLSASSLISTWFDLLLRPALREPRLASAAVVQAKELVLAALENSEESPEKVGDFRRRVMDLYLLDALNEGSGDDILDWAELDEDSREKRVWWKSNLEDILVRFGLRCPKELMTVSYHCFSSPTFRLQILILLDSLVTHPSFVEIAPTLASHPMLSSLLLCLQIDNSSTVCTFGMTSLVKLLPIMAVEACSDLKRILPQLLAILGRMVCWKARQRSTTTSNIAYADLLDENDTTLLLDIKKAVDSQETTEQPGLRGDITWERLERSFDPAVSTAPLHSQYFAFLYYLFPCNTIAFLRRPAAYLSEMGAESPYTVGWDKVLDEGKIRSESESSLRSYTFHPSIVWRDARMELDGTDQWASYDVSRIVGECVMLEVSNAAFTLRERAGQASEISQNTAEATTPTAHAAIFSGFHEKAHRKHKISVQDMIATSVALKSGADVEIIDPGHLWPLPGSNSEASSSAASTMETSSSSSEADMPSPTRREDPSVPAHIVETIAGLQREVLLLRNELNFELWLKRENVRHIGRLHQDRVVTKHADLERQGLHNKLREYKGQLVLSQTQLTKHQGQAADMKQKYSEWNAQLQNKLNDLREQKKAWMTEATEMRASNKEAKAHLAAQGRLLADAQNKVFQLETQIKEDAHKVQRLRDYEKRIEQLTTMHRMWNDDVRLYNEQAKEMSQLMSDYQKMVLRLESYEKANQEMEETNRANRRRIRSLEANLGNTRRSSEGARRNPVQAHMSHPAERSGLVKVNEQLRAENEELRDQTEELKAMVEYLKAQAQGGRGLVDSGFRVET